MLLLIYSCSDRVLIIRERRRAKSREAAAFSARARTEALERWRLVREAAVLRKRSLQRRFSRKFSCNKSIKPVEEQEMLASGTFFSDDASTFPLSTAAEDEMPGGSSMEIEIVSKEESDLYGICDASFDELDDFQEAPASDLSAYNVKKRKAHRPWFFLWFLSTRISLTLLDNILMKQIHLNLWIKTIQVAKFQCSCFYTENILESTRFYKQPIRLTPMQQELRSLRCKTH